jgi:hypothetical protein
LEQCRILHTIGKLELVDGYPEHPGNMIERIAVGDGISEHPTRWRPAWDRRLDARRSRDIKL